VVGGAIEISSRPAILRTPGVSNPPFRGPKSWAGLEEPGPMNAWLSVSGATEALVSVADHLRPVASSRPSAQARRLARSVGVIWVTPHSSAGKSRPSNSASPYPRRTEGTTTQGLSIRQACEPLPKMAPLAPCRPR
jgi:hypothetical protein